MSIHLVTSPESFAALLRDHPGLALIDVRLKEDHDRSHLDGAESACLYEVGFMHRIGELVKDRSTPVCVYGQGADSHESRMAAEKLDRAGYTEVYELRIGIEGVEGITPAPPPAQVPDGERNINLAESHVEWTGRNLLNKHWGTIALKSGRLTFADGRLTGGEAILDMTKMACTDLAGNDLHDVLIAHLESDDFFDVQRYPEARVRIRSAMPLEPKTPGADNLRVYADLTMKDVTAPVVFEASVGITADGTSFAAQAAFGIDRTRWNVLYGSGKFFRRLGGHMVNDRIDLQLRVVAPIWG